MRWRFPTLSLLLLATPLAAQSPPDRISLDRFRDSLGATHDTVALKLLRRSLARRSTGAPVTALRAAYAALRLTALGVDPDAGDARSGLRALARARTRVAVCLARAGRSGDPAIGMAAADPLALGNRVGTGSAGARARCTSSRAVAADPAYAPAAVSLASLALGLRDTAFFRPARDALRRAESAQPSAPRQTSCSRVAGSSAPRARPTSAAARVRPGGHGRRSGARALARLELARTRFALGAAGGDSAYYEGVRG